MCSPYAVISAFEAFDAAGLRPPPTAGPGEGRPERLARLAKAWAASFLADLTDEQVGRATLAWCLGGSAWWPTAGQLRQALPVEPSAAIDWGEGWARLEVVRLRHPGGASVHATIPASYHPDAGVDAAIRAGLDAIGGWRAYGRLEQDQEGTARAHFRGAYLASMERSRRSREDAAVSALMGGSGPVQVEQREGWARAGDVLPMRRREDR